MRFKNFRAVVALILTGAAVLSCATIPESRESKDNRRIARLVSEAEDIIWSVNQRQDYTGPYQNVRILLAGLLAKDTAKLRQVKLTEQADWLEAAKANGDLVQVQLGNLVAFPTPVGVRIKWTMLAHRTELIINIPEGGLEQKGKIEDLEGSYDIPTPIFSQDPDALLSAEDLRQKYGPLNVSCYRPYRGYAEICGFNLFRRDLESLLLAVAWFERGVDSGVRVASGSEGVVVSFTDRAKIIKLYQADRAFWLFAKLADSYGNGNKIMSPWEYARFLKQAGAMVAWLEGKKVSAEALAILKKDGFQPEQAAKWIADLSELTRNGMIDIEKLQEPRIKNIR